MNNKKVILFGAGQLGESIVDYVPDDVEVIAFTDNDTMKTGRLIKGFRVIDPGSIIGCDFDFVVITTSAVVEVRRQLTALGIPYAKILMPENGEPSGRWMNQQVEYERFYSLSDDPSNIDAEVVTGEFLIQYVKGLNYHPNALQLWEHKKKSMLSTQILMVLRYLAMAVQGRVLEIGAYIGGGTMAMASGVAAVRRYPVISVECGGSHMTHPRLPTDDIFRDLKNNIEQSVFSDHVILLRGKSFDMHIKEQIAREVLGQGIGLLMIDADGWVERDLHIYGPLLNEGAFLVFDDYSSELAKIKMDRVKPWTDRMVKEGVFEKLGVFPWGTWVGRLKKNIFE